jgi:isopentenyl diphosphate isomerase/L-lactate dehydrogenase-like FMN-dependent dehydrogenase
MDAAALERRGYSIAQLRRMARRILPRLIFDFIDGGAEDEVTLRGNETTFADFAFRPRPLNGTTTRDQSVELFGERIATPVLIGPTGLSGMVWPQGEADAARAAHAAGTIWVMSHGSTVTIEEMPKRSSGPLWMQVFMYRDRGLTRAFTERAQAAGYKALVLTVDNQVLGQRERDLVNGFAIPPRVTVRNSLDMVLRVPWLMRMVPHLKGVTFRNYPDHDKLDISSLAAHIGTILDPGLAWKDVAWLRSIWKGPLLLKGILHPDEARAAIDHGVDGVIVSNHGGRQLDGALASLRALPAVVEAAGDRLVVLLDGGVRRGSDVVKALALGARACLVGRPHLWGLTVAGEAGVARVLEIYRREIDRTLALGGWDGVEALEPGILEPPAWLPGASLHLHPGRRALRPEPAVLEATGD